MSQIYFQAKVNLTNATPSNEEMSVWECELAFTDNEGVFTGLTIQVGDVVMFDTGAYETGTFSFYDVTSIITPDASYPVVTLEYNSANDNISGSPDLGGYIIGSDGVISRPSPNYGLLPVVSRDIQLISDKFTEYVQNYNFTKIVDTALAQSGGVKFVKINREAFTIFKGIPVYISEVDFNDIYRASGGGSYEQARVAGLVNSTSILTDSIGQIISTGLIEQPTNLWDNITGDTGGLKGGKDYFIRNDFTRGITDVPPTTGYVVKIGKALSPTMLDVNIEPPILL